jgi:thioredoxin reductase
MEKQVDYLILGAGPSGLQLGYFMEKAGRDYLILEAGDSPGTFFKKFPRHRTLISNNKVYTGYEDPEVNLRFDWNSLLCDSEQLLFKNYSKKYFPPADEFVRYLGDFARHYNLKINFGTRVVKVSKSDGFKVTDQNGNTYSCKRFIIATGFIKPYVPAIPGIELAENYTDVSVNPEDFINKRVLVLGKGNSAFETADNLLETAALIHIASPNPVKMAWKSHFVGHLRAVNNNVLDTYQLKSQNALLDANIERIERRDGKYVVSVSYVHANGDQEELIYDRVIICTGWRFDDSIFDETCRPALAINNRFPAQTSAWESTNVKDLYFAGTLTQMRDYKKSTSGFIHGFRYNVRALSRILENRYHGVEWLHHKVKPTPEALTESVIERINKSSALWQQFGFIGDLLIVKEDGSEALHYEEVPVDYVHDTEFGQHQQYYTLTLEYGPEEAFEDPFCVNRVARDEIDNSHLSIFLHPVVRRFSGSTMIAEHHVIEDLLSEWREDIHIQPLLEFFKSEVLKDEMVGVG